MNWSEFMSWAFLGLTGGAVGILWLAVKSLVELNIKIAVVIDKIEGHEQRIKDLERR